MDLFVNLFIASRVSTQQKKDTCYGYCFAWNVDFECLLQNAIALLF